MEYLHLRSQTATRSLALSFDGVFLAAIYLAAWYATRTTLYVEQSATLGAAIWFDLTFTAALVHYVAGVRTARVPGWTILPVLGIGLTLASILAPEFRSESATLFVLIAGTAELSIAGIVIWRGAQLARAYRESRASGALGLEAVEYALEKVTGFRWLAVAVRSEIEIFSLAFLGWFRRPSIRSGHVAFTVHRRIAWFPLVGVLVVLSIFEAGVVHFLLFRAEYFLLAWTITLLHIYGLLWLIGDAHAIRLYPLQVTPVSVQVRIGLRWSATLERDNIERVVGARREPEDALALTLFGAPNLIVYLKEEIEVRGLFGIRRKAKRLALAVDTPDEFISVLAGEIRAP